MKSAIYGMAVILASFGVFSMAAIHHTGKSSAKTVTISHDPDGITGEWDASLEAFGTITKVKIVLDCDDNKLSGTAESGHTGAGTISDGSCQDGKINFIAKFAKHESVSFKGEVKDGKLIGEYATEGRVSKWEAVKKVKTDAPATAKPKTNSDGISGDWEASLIANDTNAGLTIKLNLEGSKINGTFESEHLGNGTIENGSWADNKISFSIKSTPATINFNGILKDGKLTGDFSAGKMTGKWEAQQK